MSNFAFYIEHNFGLSPFFSDILFVVVVAVSRNMIEILKLIIFRREKNCFVRFPSYHATISVCDRRWWKTVGNKLQWNSLKWIRKSKIQIQNHAIIKWTHICKHTRKKTQTIQEFSAEISRLSLDLLLIWNWKQCQIICFSKKFS